MGIDEHQLVEESLEDLQQVLHDMETIEKGSEEEVRQPNACCMLIHKRAINLPLFAVFVMSYVPHQPFNLICIHACSKNAPSTFHPHAHECQNCSLNFYLTDRMYVCALLNTSAL